MKRRTKRKKIQVTNSGDVHTPNRVHRRSEGE